MNPLPKNQRFKTSSLCFSSEVKTYSICFLQWQDFIASAVTFGFMGSLLNPGGFTVHIIVIGIKGSLPESNTMTELLYLSVMMKRPFWAIPPKTL